MFITPDPPQLSRHARELARILRMSGAKAGDLVRLGKLEALWVRHVPRPSFKDLEAAMAELVAAKLLTRERPDGVVMTEEVAALR